jgi:hypothetical protein
MEHTSDGKGSHFSCCWIFEGRRHSSRCREESVLSLRFIFLFLIMIGLPQAYKTSWGLKCPGTMRGKLLGKLADLVEANLEEFAALESLDVGECEGPFCWEMIRYE